MEHQHGTDHSKAHASVGTSSAGGGTPRRRRTFSALAAGTPTAGHRGGRGHGGPSAPRETGAHSGAKQGGRGGHGGRGRPGGGRGHGGPQRRPRTQPAHTKFERPSDGVVIPPPEEGVLRFIPLGGVEEIGRNMTAIEYGDEIIVIDAGLQFGEVETPGVDFILPDVTYLRERKDKILGVFITHGHLDHIGAIPYVMEDMGNPPLYSRAFGALMIQKRQAEFPHVPTLNIKTVRGDERMQIGKHFTVNFFPISHAIPDSMGILIDTPVGTIAFIEDVRVDHVNGVATSKEIEHYARFKDKKMLLLTLDSTSVEKPGFSIPESYAIETIDKIMGEVSGRLIIGTFASNVERIIQMVLAVNKYNKKLVVDGRSMKSNLEIVKQLDLVPLDNMIPIEEMADHPPGKVVIIATGAQGEEYAVFDRIANKTHKYITLNPTDTVLFSSSVIPGNEMAVQKLKDNLYRQDAKIITYLDTSVHASGHGNRDELGWIHEQINYKYFVPLHGHHYMLKIHADLSQSKGTPRENIVVPDDGSIIEFYDGGEKMRVRKEKAPSDPIMVDGFSVGGQQEVVLRDRQSLSEDGIFMVVVSVNPKTGKLRKSPDIISRGFVYLKEQQDLINEARSLVSHSVEKNTRGMQPINFDIVKNMVTDDVRKFLFQKTGKNPIVIPVVIGV
ncbi:MAG: ribonuclease J [Candidatus Pacebacteria bacterium]|nr:ribonuclease J [Candidatus Paceibacterota bacterium]